MAPGAYGFQLDGIPDAGDLLIEAPAEWPRLTLVRGQGKGRPKREEVTADHARLWLASGSYAEVDRAAASALVVVPPGTTDAALVHPFLAPVALIMSRWLGRESMHGGAIVIDGGAWGVLGHKTAGKSTTLAAMAQAGVDVLSDDVLVIHDGVALAGPRSVDLRREAAQRLQAGEPMGRVGARSRWRLQLGGVAAEVPLRGWISLEWGNEVTVERLQGAQRLATLLPHRGVRLLPAAPDALLQLSALPTVRLTRPRRWESLGEATDRLVGAIAG